MKKLFLYSVIYFIGICSCCNNKNSNSSKQAKSSISKTPKSFNNIMQFDVPGDGNCMLDAVAMQYLLMARDKYGKLIENLIKDRFKTLFTFQSSEINPDEYQAIINEIKTLGLNLRQISQNNQTVSISDTRWINLLNTFRQKVSFFMEMNKSNLENFFAPNNPEDGNAKNFKNYLEKTKTDGEWLGHIHLYAISGVLNNKYIKLYKRSKEGNLEKPNNESPINPNEDDKEPIILFHLGNHYNFGLEKKYCL